MGTRSLTRVHRDIWDKDADPSRCPDKPLICIYRQFDGYPDGMGADLISFLRDITLVNGIPCSADEAAKRKMANTMGCLAAQLVKHLKDDIGNIYLYPADAHDCGEEYVYDIWGVPGQPLYLRIAEAGWTERDYSKKPSKKGEDYPIIAVHPEVVLWSGPLTKRNTVNSILNRIKKKETT